MSSYEISKFLIRLVKDLEYILNNLDTANVGKAGFMADQVSDFGSQTIKAFKGEFEKARAGKVDAQYISALVAQLASADIDAAKIKNLTAVVLKAVSAELEQLAAGSVDTYELTANLGRLIQVEAEKVQADEATVSILTSAINYTISLYAQTAGIDMLTVKDLVTDRSIIRQGAAGELYIDELVLTDGNAARMSIGKLLIQDEETGEWYRLTVSDDGVSAVRERAYVTDENIQDNSVDGGKIVDGTVNARKLAAETVMANEAFINAVVGGMATFGSLTANEALVQQLTTSLIKANEALRIVIEKGPTALEGLDKYVDFDAGVKISAEGSNFWSQWTETMLGFWQSAQLVAYISGGMFHADRMRSNKTHEVADWQIAQESGGGMTVKYIGG
jgi:hypothetical protein